MAPSKMRISSLAGSLIRKNWKNRNTRIIGMMASATSHRLDSRMLRRVSVVSGVYTPAGGITPPFLIFKMIP